jgi:DHA3 family macrolide efflux protein-like MFS transporter
MNLSRESESTRYNLFTVSYLALLSGQIVSILGDRLNNIALVELIAEETGRFSQSGSTLEMSKLFLAFTLPSLILGPLVGAYVDRANRKRTLIITDLIRGLAVLAVPFMRPALPLWTVYVMVAVLYFANLFFLPARCAIVTEIVPRERLMKANSGLTIGATVASIVGFFVGGMVAAKAGWRFALYIDSATYFASAFALTFIRAGQTGKEHIEVSRAPYTETIKQALRVMRRSAAARLGVISPAILVLAGTTAFVLGTAMIERSHPEGTMYVGFIAGVAGLGMAAGSVLTSARFHGTKRARIIRTWVPAVIVPLAVLALTRNLWLMGLGVALAGFAAGPVFVTSETAIQEDAPMRRQATVFAFRDMLMKISALAAAWLAGLVPTLMGERPTLGTLLALWLIIWLVLGYRSQTET